MAEKRNEEYLLVRLDIIIRLLAEILIKDKKSSVGDTVQLMNSIGLGPKDIAKIFGKKSPTDVAGYLYRGKAKKKH